MRRLTIVLGFIFLFVFAFSRLHLLYGGKFFDVTGNAEWIWQEERLADGFPAAFYATRDFDLPPQRSFTHIKILGDPEYTLYFNGTEVGGRRVGEESALDEFDVSKLARDKKNRMVVAVRSANGVGGLIASIDIAPDFRFMGTGRDWHIVTQWRPDILLRDNGLVLRPMLLGRPPARRWNYLSRRPGVLLAPVKSVLPPKQAIPLHTALAEIRIVEGVAVTAATPVQATAYDFGVGATGRLRLTVGAPSLGPHVISVRFATDRSELSDVEGGVEKFIFAPGETSVVDPQRRVFRYAEVFGSSAKAEVLSQ
jgi:hypothetical protein